MKINNKIFKTIITSKWYLWVVICALASIYVYLAIIKDGVKNNLSSALIKDISEGEDILRYSHIVDSLPPQYRPTIYFAPDSKSFISLSDSRKIIQFDIINGSPITQIAEQLSSDEIYSVNWSNDGRFLALRTNGDKVNVLGNALIRYNNRIRLYSIPEYKVIGEFEYKNNNLGKACFENYGQYGQAVIFSPDLKSIWVRCGHYYTKPSPENILGIKLNVPLMNVSEIKYYGSIASRGAVDNISAIGMSEEFSVINDSVVYWTMPSKQNTPYFYDLTNNNEINVPDMSKDNIAGKLSFMKEVKSTGNEVSLSFCGKPTDVSNPVSIPEISSFTKTSTEDLPFIEYPFCRTLVFNIKSGNLISITDYANRHRKLHSDELTDSQNKIRVEASWQENSKMGDINVFDVATNTKKQHIITYAQEPLAFSPDGKWLVMYAINQKMITVYRVKD